MVRARKQPPAAPGLEAGAAYGEVSDNLESQKAIPLPQKSAVGEGPQPAGMAAPPSAAPQAAPPPLPIDSANNFANTVTPLTAPGRGLNKPSRAITIDNEMRAASFLNKMAEISDDPNIRAAASQMSGRLSSRGAND